LRNSNAPIRALVRCSAAEGGFVGDGDESDVGMRAKLARIAHIGAFAGQSAAGSAIRRCFDLDRRRDEPLSIPTLAHGREIVGNGVVEPSTFDEAPYATSVLRPELVGRTLAGVLCQESKELLSRVRRHDTLNRVDRVDDTDIHRRHFYSFAAAARRRSNDVVQLGAPDAA